MFSCSALTRSVNCGAERAAVRGLSPGPPHGSGASNPGWGVLGGVLCCVPAPAGERERSPGPQAHVRRGASPISTMRTPHTPKGGRPAHAHLQLLVLPLQILQDELQLVLVLALALTVRRVLLGLAAAVLLAAVRGQTGRGARDSPSHTGWQSASGLPSFLAGPLGTRPTSDVIQKVWKGSLCPARHRKG